MASLPKFFDGSLETEQEVSSGRCAVRTIIWHNDHSAAMFMQIFNLPASSITVGTTVPDLELKVGADATQTFDFGDALFDTGLTFAITTLTNGTLAGGVHSVMIGIV